VARWALWVVCLAAMGCDGGGKDTGDGDRVSTILALEGDPAAGQGAYESQCSACHGASGEGGVGPALTGVDADPETTITQILEGGEGMQPYDTLPDQDIANIYAYMVESF
jgi:mono/diheme cytochrome c family protein